MNPSQRLAEVAAFFETNSCSVSLQNVKPLRALRSLFGSTTKPKRFHLNKVNNTFLLTEINLDKVERFKLVEDTNAKNPFGARVYLSKDFELTTDDVNAMATAYAKVIDGVIQTGNVALLKDCPFMLYHADFAFSVVLDEVFGTQELQKEGLVPPLLAQLLRAWDGTPKRNGEMYPVEVIMPNNEVALATLTWDETRNQLGGFLLSKTVAGFYATQFFVNNRGGEVSLETNRGKLPIEAAHYHEQESRLRTPYSPNVVQEKLIEVFTNEKNSAQVENRIVSELEEMAKKLPINRKNAGLWEAKLKNATKKLSFNNTKALDRLWALAMQLPNSKHIMPELQHGKKPRNSWIDSKLSAKALMAATLSDVSENIMVSKDGALVVLPFNSTSFNFKYEGSKTNGVVTVLDAPVGGEQKVLGQVAWDVQTMALEAQSRLMTLVEYCKSLLMPIIMEATASSPTPEPTQKPELVPEDVKRRLVLLAKANRLMMRKHTGFGSSIELGILDNYNRVITWGVLSNDIIANVKSDWTNVSEAELDFTDEALASAALVVDQVGFVGYNDSVKQKSFFAMILNRIGATWDSVVTSKKTKALFTAAYRQNEAWEGNSGFASPSDALDAVYVKLKQHLPSNDRAKFEKEVDDVFLEVI